MREGVALAVSGYPLDEPSLVTNAGILATTFSLHGGAQRYLGDFTANPGNSGGPVYSVSDAAVVGLCVGGKLAPIVGGVGAHTAGLTVIVPVEEVRSLLDRNGLSASATLGDPGGARHKRKKRRR